MLYAERQYPGADHAGPSSSLDQGRGICWQEISGAGITEVRAIVAALRSDDIPDTMDMRSKIGEIDIIAIKDKILTFVEVKSRYDDTYGRPFEAVNTYKAKKIREDRKRHV